MEILTPKSMAKCDQETIYEGYPEMILMESAAYGVAEITANIIKQKFLKSFSNTLKNKDIKITVLVGKGNNGGDGLAAARILNNWGYQPEIILSSKKDNLSGVNKKNLNLAKYHQLKIYEYDSLSEESFLERVKKSNILIDSLLGTGIQGELRGNAKKIIESINNELSQQPLTIAVDIPSGINGYTGGKAGNALKADYTAVMAAYKRGLVLFPGRDYAGEVKIIDIGIKQETIIKNSEGIKLFNFKKAEKLLPKRSNNIHKGSVGKVAILAGSKGMTGAPLLSSDAAIRSGAGIVYLLTAEEIELETAVQLKEIVSYALPSENGIISEQSSDLILEFIEKVDFLAAGPGLSQTEAVKKVIKKILQTAAIPLLLDADAINVISDLNDLKKYQGELLLTPHPGEMSRLTGISIKKINNNRIEIAQNFAKEYNLNIILKGAATVTAAADGRTYINNSGCNGMATAGSGDVLTGIISALKGQKLSFFEAAALAVYIHGKAGEKAAEKLSNYSLKAGDIIKYLPEAFKMFV